jgi:hypothetical protein
VAQTLVKGFTMLDLDHRRCGFLPDVPFGPLEGLREGVQNLTQHSQRRAAAGRS